MTRMLLALILVLAPLSLAADVLLIDEVRQVDRLELPDNGQSKSEVESRYGEPVKKHDAVGNPPITRWEYDRYSVYFEYDRVLFTVLHSGEVVDKA